MLKTIIRGVNHFLEIPGNQKSRTPKPEIPLKNEKSRTLNVEVIYPSGKTDFELDYKENGMKMTLCIPRTSFYYIFSRVNCSEYSIIIDSRVRPKK